MSVDDSAKIIENNSVMADEEDRCIECGCLLSVVTEYVDKKEYEVWKCKNMDCKKFNLIQRRYVL